MKMHPIANQLSLLLILPAAFSSTSKDPLLLTEDHSGQFFLPEHSRQPAFSESETNVTAQLGGSAFLHCPVVNSGDRAVSYSSISWIRLRDWHILSNGVVTYTSDSRFQVLHKDGSYDWILQVKYVKERDAGNYECQVSTNTGTLSRRVRLRVVTPEAFILGGDEYHIDRGSQISLVCVIENAPTPPQYVFWYHNHRMVNYDTDKGISVTTTAMAANAENHQQFGGDSSSSSSTKSLFAIAEATPNDSGNYTCMPSNAAPASIQVFVSDTRVDKTEALHKQSSLESSGSATAASGSSLSSMASSNLGNVSSQVIFCALAIVPSLMASTEFNP